MIVLNVAMLSWLLYVEATPVEVWHAKQATNKKGSEEWTENYGRRNTGQKFSVICSP
jgi:hypothetical protein